MPHRASRVFKRRQIHLSGCRRISPVAEFEAAQASCSSSFALAAAVPPLKDEKLSSAKLREPPLPHGFATWHSNFCRGATRSSLCSASRSEPCAPGKWEISPSATRLRSGIAAGATAPAPYSLLNDGKCVSIFSGCRRISPAGAQLEARFARLLVLSCAPRGNGRFRLRRPAYAAGSRQVQPHLQPKSFYYFTDTILIAVRGSPENVPSQADFGEMNLEPQLAEILLQ